MSAWILGKSKRYSGVEINSNLDKNLIKNIIEKECGLRWEFIAFVFLFTIAGLILAFIGISDNQIVLTSPEFSFKGGLAGLSFVGAMQCAYLARVKIIIK